MDKEEKRFVYIDVLRGMTMVLVVFHHVLGFCEIPRNMIEYGIKSFRMPMFFFISGFIAYKALKRWTPSYIFNRFIRKIRIQVIPTIFFFSLYCLIINRTNPLNYFIDNGWYGYWFTIVIFEVFVLFYVVNLFSCHSKKFNNYTLLAVTVGCILFMHYMPHNNVTKYCEAHNVLKFCPYFIAGLFVRQYSEVVFEKLEKISVLVVLLIIFFGLLLAYVEGKTIPDLVTNILYHFLNVFGVSLVFGLFVRYRKVIQNNNRITTFLSFAGQRTLSIYLLHFFFLDSSVIIYKCISFSNWLFLDRIALFVLSVFIVVMCLVISETLGKIAFLRQNLFGHPK